MSRERSSAADRARVQARFVVVVVLARATPPALVVLANHFLWPWVTRSANVGWAVWIVAMGLIACAALVASVLAGLACPGPSLARAVTIVVGLAAQSAFLLRFANG